VEARQQRPELAVARRRRRRARTAAGTH
jgi:hypothetical protein